MRKLELVDAEPYMFMDHAFKAGTGLGETRDIIDAEVIALGRSTKIIKQLVSEPLWGTRMLVAKTGGTESKPGMSPCPAVSSIQAWEALKSLDLPTWENAALATIDEKGLHFLTPDAGVKYDQVVTAMPFEEVSGRKDWTEKIDRDYFDQMCESITAQLRDGISENDEIDLMDNVWMFGIREVGGQYQIDAWIGDLDKIDLEGGFGQDVEGVVEHFERATNDLLSKLGAEA